MVASGISLPYDSTTLQWNDKHTLNDQNKYCYCGNNRTLHELNLLCCRCLNWFHMSCLRQPISATITSKTSSGSTTTTEQLLPFTVNYVFTCAMCSPSGMEEFKRTDARWKQIAIMAMANTLLNATMSPNDDSTTTTTSVPVVDPISGRISPDTPGYSAEGLAPILERNWKVVCTNKKRVSFDNMIIALLKEFKVGQQIYRITYEGQNRMARRSTFYDDCLFNILPEGVMMTMNNASSIGDDTSSVVVSSSIGDGSGNDGQLLPQSKRARTRGTENSDAMTTLKALSHDRPMNKYGYRYSYAELDPLREFFYREVQPSSNVTISSFDYSPLLRVSPDRVSVYGDRGYNMARASHGVGRGDWYFEVTMLESRPPEGLENPPEAHCRLGWSMKYGNLQAPTGYDAWSYSYRSKHGTKFHQSLGEPYGLSYGPSDTVGLHIHIEEVPQLLPKFFKEKVLIDFKSTAYFETKDPANVLDTRVIGKGSYISSWVNGVPQGVMFRDLAVGIYYPAISLYMGAGVQLNFGPTFKHIRPDGARPVSEVVHESLAGLVVADLVSKTEDLLSDKPAPITTHHQ